jgi:hypothetical protein
MAPVVRRRAEAMAPAKLRALVRAEAAKIAAKHQ